MLLSHRSFQVFSVLLPLLCHEVAANTEIINFSSYRERTVDLPLAVVGNWSKLNHSDNERQCALEPAALHTPLHQVCENDDTIVSSHPPFACPHELWLFLDLDDEKWISYSSFTFRLSWAASTPADFLIEIYSPETALARLSKQHQISTGPEHTHTNINASPQTSTTRSKYARIRAVNAGIPTPHLHSQSSSWWSWSRPQPRVASSSPPHPPPHPRPHPEPRHTDSDTPANVAVKRLNGSPMPIPFIVILEPLYLGVLPASLLPTVGFLIPIFLVATLSVSRIIAYFDTFVQQAREDLNSGRMAFEKKGR